VAPASAEDVWKDSVADRVTKPAPLVGHEVAGAVVSGTGAGGAVVSSWKETVLTGATWPNSSVATTRHGDRAVGESPAQDRLQHGARQREGPLDKRGEAADETATVDADWKATMRPASVTIPATAGSSGQAVG